LFGGTSGFKFQPAGTTAAGASSVFSGGSLFGGPGIGASGSLFAGGSLFSQTGIQSGGLFANAGTGSSLFSNAAPLFGGNNALHAKKTDGDEDDEDDDDNDEPQQADDEPPAFAGDDQT
jgi:hypothetical protein